MERNPAAACIPALFDILGLSDISICACATISRYERASLEPGKASCGGWCLLAAGLDRSSL
jgi:hypothetical protein